MVYGSFDICITIMHHYSLQNIAPATKRVAGVQCVNFILCNPNQNNEILYEESA